MAPTTNSAKPINIILNWFVAVAGSVPEPPVSVLSVAVESGSVGLGSTHSGSAGYGGFCSGWSNWLYGQTKDLLLSNNEPLAFLIAAKLLSTNVLKLLWYPEPSYELTNIQ